MRLCAGTKRDGSPCTVSVAEGLPYCHHHDPARSEDRRRAASKAGRSRPNAEISNVKRELLCVVDGVLQGDIERGIGAVAAQLYGVILRALVAG